MREKLNINLKGDICLKTKKKSFLTMFKVTIKGHNLRVN